MQDSPGRNANFDRVSNGSFRNAAIHEAAWRIFGEPAVLRYNQRQEPWTHVVVCGLARSGTTLLQTLLSHPDNGFQVFPDEIQAVRAVTRHRVKRPYLLSKRPSDVLRIEQIRDLYGTRQSSVRFILSIRDPRDVLVSRHPGSRSPTEPFVTPAGLERRLLEILRFQDAEDCFVSRYEDLVHEPSLVKQRLSDFLGTPLRGDWAAGSTSATRLLSRMSQQALVRPRELDRGSIGKWRDHPEATAALTAQHPVLVHLSGMLGYRIDAGLDSVRNELST